MIARTIRVQVPLDRVDGVLEAYRDDVRPIHARAAGLTQHYVLADRGSGTIEFIGIWDSAEALAQVAAELEPARQRLWERFGTSPPLAVFDVVDELRSGGPG